MFALKKLPGNGLEEPSGTPSQLISRRPLPTDPGLFELSVPRSARNASTWPWMAAALAPDAAKVRGAAAELAGLIRIGRESATTVAAVAVTHFVSDIGAPLGIGCKTAMQEICWRDNDLKSLTSSRAPREAGMVTCKIFRHTQGAKGAP